MDVEVAWFSQQSEYRPTEYLQNWVKFWFKDALRLEAAKTVQRIRLQRVAQAWTDNRLLAEEGFQPRKDLLLPALEKSKQAIAEAADGTALLAEEARLTKLLFKLAARAVDYGDFTRAKRGTGTDPANRFLDHGNYLAYGLGATATWVLGLPHGLAVLHGKTRRGGLVFDAADLVKDAVVLPQAFLSAMRGDDEQTFRHACIESFTRTESLDFMIDSLKAIALEVGVKAP
jgi:CRISPR-associated protein Cas1